MKLIGQDLGRVIVLFPMEDVRPDSGTPVLDLFNRITERYKFAKLPDLNKSVLEFNRDGYAFEFGSFLYQDKSTAVTEFTIYNDGISVSCFDTAQAEGFFSDVMGWARETFGLKEFVREPKKIYRSQIIVEFEKSLNKLVRDFSELSRLVNLAYSEHTEYNAPFNLNRLDLRMDDTKIPGIKPLSFILERKIGAPHETERYVSEAPIPSRAHVHLLQSIENMLP